MIDVIVVAVHPDDETLGCGGTLLKHKQNGHRIHWIIVTEIKEKDGFSKELIKKREKEIEIVQNMYDFDSVHRLKYSTTKLDIYPLGDLVESFSKIISTIKPHTLYLPFESDVHSDHQIAFKTAFSCTKSFRYSSIKRILMMETLSETEFSTAKKETQFVANSFNDISKYIDKKLEIMRVYEGEMGAHPFPRSEKSIRALATYRGSTAGVDSAESFMLIKEIL